MATVTAMPTALEAAPVDPHWLALFEDRYGAGAHARLIAQLRQPCLTFADIAARFGVTRERVRQWHLQLLPGAPTGHQRQRLCLVHQQKRRLLADALFGGFYRQVRRHVAPQRLTLIPSGDRFRKRAVRLDNRVIALKTARRCAAPARPDGAAIYALTNGRSPADFIYYQLTPTDYLFVPKRLLPDAGTTFIDTGASKYRAFKNSFAALSLVSTAPGSPRSGSARSGGTRSGAWSGGARSASLLLEAVRAAGV